MADVVNLRIVRKQRDRAEARRRADTATAESGATAAEAERAKALSELERRRLDGHRRDDDPPDGAA